MLEPALFFEWPTTLQPTDLVSGDTVCKQWTTKQRTAVWLVNSFQWDFQGIKSIVFLGDNAPTCDVLRSLTGSAGAAFWHTLWLLASCVCGASALSDAGAVQRSGVSTTSFSRSDVRELDHSDWSLLIDWSPCNCNVVFIVVFKIG